MTLDRFRNWFGFAANAEDVSLVRQEVIAAIQDARKASPDLSSRIESEAARVARRASRLVRTRLEEQWND